MSADAQTAKELQGAWSELVDVADRVATHAFNAAARWLDLTGVLRKAKELLDYWLISPSSPEGQDIVKKDEEELHRRFGPSPWGTTGVPPGVQPAPGAAAMTVTPTAGGPFGDEDFDTYRNRGLSVGRRVGAIAPGRADFATYLHTGPTVGPPGGGTTNNSSSSTNIGTVNVTISGAESPEETGRSVYRWFQRFSQGASTYNGPH
jgi:hypothetical protein